MHVKYDNVVIEEKDISRVHAVRLKLKSAKDDMGTVDYILTKTYFENKVFKPQMYALLKEKNGKKTIIKKKISVSKVKGVMAETK